jgi:phosphatidate cytidylyltransferase
VLFLTGEFWFGVQVVVFVALALHEFLTLLKKSQVPVYRLFGIAMGVVIPTIVYMEMGSTQSGEILFLVLGCLFLFLLQFFRRDNAEALAGIALTLFGILYISWFLSFLIKIRFLPDGARWAAYLIVVTKSADIGAYLVGSLLGRHALIPHVSPKKTVEGALGGMVTSLGVSVALGPLLPVHLGVPHLAIVGAMIGIVGQIGDLSASLMKRFCRAKDSGNLVPGMGGFLDVVDSILFTAPIFYFHLKLIL